VSIPAFLTFKLKSIICLLNYFVKEKKYSDLKAKFLLKRSAHLKRLMKENQAVVHKVLKDGPLGGKYNIIIIFRS